MIGAQSDCRGIVDAHIGFVPSLELDSGLRNSKPDHTVTQTRLSDPCPWDLRPFVPQGHFSPGPSNLYLGSTYQCQAPARPFMYVIDFLSSPGGRYRCLYFTVWLNEDVERLRSF